MIKRQVEKIFKEATERFATENDTEVKNIQVLLGITNEKVLSYTLCVGFTPIKQLTFNEILGKEVDFLGREFLATPFLQNAFTRLQRELEIEELQNAKVIVFPKDNEAKSFGLYVYDGSTPKKQIDLDYVFNEESILN